MQRSILELMVLVFLSFLIAIPTLQGAGLNSAQAEDLYSKYYDRYSYLDDLLCPIDLKQTGDGVLQKEGANYCGYFDTSFNDDLLLNSIKEVNQENFTSAEAKSSI
ncbi:MAG: hypothetical protein CME70_22670 [Halobacteriovorax sp.]|nr:hypothetical protein [Halobacteriovorax sp.]|tara:strand:+ start:42820 stop:43137 length:318 start_codon:yes stop_codon:yes gene_type:complete